MIAAPIFFIASDSVWPITSSEAVDMLDDATGSTGRAYSATILGLVALTLMAGAVIGLAHLLHERRPGLAMLLNVGLVVLAVGLYRARVVASWSALALGVGAIALAVANPIAVKPVILAAEVVLLAGLGSVGWLILTETEEEWEHTPEFSGYGSAVTA
ncbi:MAG TPA: hypothetical protein VI854_02310 [Acidimicrobiia bacterium]|nr:hypothetical protein [Acidimicrobiia bacterium]